MRKLLYAAVVAVAAAAIVAVVATRGPAPQAGTASSHREAPLISEDPTADNTDLYAFRSLDKPDMLTVVSNFIPAEDPGAGPNYYRFSSTARYNINIDRNGDGTPDLVYRFQFQNKPGQFFLGNTQQSYTVTRIVNGKASTFATGQTPPDNIGPRTTPNYRKLASDAVVATSDGGRVFAGQREDAFYADIGAIFDLVAIRVGTGNAGGGKDFFAGYAVHALALQIPISAIDTSNHVVGVWSSVDRPKLKVGTVTRKVKGKKVRRTVVTKSFVQVSRIANPLFNELIVPTELKDKWNAGTPIDDKNFVKFVTDPILAAVINKLYPGLINAPEHGRDDLVQVLLTGIPNLNSTGPKPLDLLRINLSTPPTPAAQVNRLGVLGGDMAGYPNGRRLGDDVIDIAEQAVGGVLKGNAKAKLLGDGVNRNDQADLNAFPYENDPFSGFDNTKGQVTAP